MNVLYTRTDIAVVDWELIAELKRMADQHPLRRSRLCLHREADDPTHEMIIVAHRSTYIRPHRHPRHKSESYHIIEGELEVRIFDDYGGLQKAISLVVDLKRAFMYRVTNSRWHQPVPRTEWVVYHETYSGPFDKVIDVEYASWAPEEQAT